MITRRFFLTENGRRSFVLAGIAALFCLGLFLMVFL